MPPDVAGRHFGGGSRARRLTGPAYDAWKGGAVESIAHEVWGWRGEIGMPAGVRFPLRMTGIRLPDGAMWLHSPVALDDVAAAEIDRLGPVRHIVAPSKLHSAHAAAALARWPEARLYGAVGLRDVHPELRIDEELGSEAPAGWGGVLEVFPVEGAPAVNEVVFLHLPSRTLLVTDLAFNVAEPANLQTAALLWIVGSGRRFRSSRLLRWRFTEDRAALSRSVRRLLEQDFDRVVPCHGEIVTAQAGAALREATEVLT
jgi:hypothetical protein